MELVKDVNEILTTIKDNVKDTQRILKTWEKNLMFERKDGRTYTFEELNDSFNQLIQQRWGLTGRGGGAGRRRGTQGGQARAALCCMGLQGAYSVGMAQ